jgi:23S rRNA pseudouridine2605 synthase
MPREFKKGNPKGRSKGPSKSGWVKPDGTPLRPRKGDYFPDKEIDKRKPSHRFDAAKKNRSERPEGAPASDRRENSESGGNFSRGNTTRNTEENNHSGKSNEPRIKSGGESYKSNRSNAEKSKRFSARASDRKDKNGPEKPFAAFEKRKPKPLKGGKPYSKRDERSGSERNKFSSASGDNRHKPTGTGRYERTADKEVSFDKHSSDREYVKKTTPEGPYKKFQKKDSFHKTPTASNDGEEQQPARETTANDNNETRKPYERKDFSNRPGKSRVSGRRESHRERRPYSPDNDGGSTKPVRLNKYIANAGMCSRREADDLITAGVISINGNIVSELGTKVMPGDVVKFHDQTLKTEKLVYVILNKPKDYITTTDDPEERKTVMSLVHNAGKERLFPVGRLDRNTTGLLLITNDGDLTKRLTHPSGNIKKIYQVELDRNLSQEDMLRAAAGVELEDGVASVDEIHYESPDDKTIVGVELHSGKNRVVRRIFEAMDYKVKKLDRVYFAGLTKKDLPRGRWRFLTELEVNMLKMLTGRKK